MFNLLGYVPFCGWFYGYGGLITWIILLAVIGLSIYFLLKIQNKHKNLEDTFNETPIDIARKRYARGEISKEEFEQLKKELQ